MNHPRLKSKRAGTAHRFLEAFPRGYPGAKNEAWFFYQLRVVGECRDIKQVVESDTQTTRFLDNGYMLNASTHQEKGC